ncbi:unnamed protein product [Hymenolepis diminuta]|uniref:Patatin n=1 Tax=Hymenolepis diminuta TaxID=6216 RepID=A0A0R3SRV2_HYMDI|nr:unnamed protein product [Hymenolepis diminuta]
MNSSDHQDNSEHVALVREAAVLLSRYGGAGGAGSLSLLGEGGKAVRLPAHLMADSKAKFALNQFDVVISDLISVNRSLPDVRHDSSHFAFGHISATSSVPIGVAKFVALQLA